MCWVTYAKEPLLVQQLQKCTCCEYHLIRDGTANIPELNTIIPACAGLVTVEEKKPSHSSSLQLNTKTSSCHARKAGSKMLTSRSRGSA
ncbi:uncharacterized protein BDW43DRAFT_262593 [Aspergillus alliaceus]|uniref:uncharacterized protein n=1 Tax=Petromyces alliaceus TaxID=209559 RepID=UPI0012A3F623|nr:uncharacterized protein BDW43DRAFT_262593 [Aspergillus alliaceus]KAB8237898.1 hypothetical protein BDW43DRAFT_262593 [Aspergillus alliaceus]